MTAIPELTPREIVQELDKFIVGQQEAKRAVAVALRNRARRRLVPEDLQQEILPKNILMIGPTGVGKTEIARRLARLVNAPFVKVEATKFTEVGYVGRDVDSMARDLVEASLRLVKEEQAAQVRERAAWQAEERLVEALVPAPRRQAGYGNPLQMLAQGIWGQQEQSQAERPPDDPAILQRRREVRQQLAAGKLESEMVEIEVPESRPSMLEMFSGQGNEQIGLNVEDLFGGLMPTRTQRRRLSVSEARKVLTQQETEKLIDKERAAQEAVRRAEEMGIIFIDELDKVAGGGGRESGPDVSREGVQRDLLPLVEGSTVMTKYGAVQTDHVLFIAAGAFHMTKPSDLIPELQGRFPIRVELSSLSEEDFTRILVEPENAITRQYTELLATEGVTLRWTPEGIAMLARLAVAVNEGTEDIGARRLYTLVEKLLEEVSFYAPEMAPAEVQVDEAFVRKQLQGIVADQDLSRYIL